MCELEKTLLRAARSVTDDQIAAEMNAYLGAQQVSADMVQKYLSGKAGIPLRYIGAFLTALGQRSVSIDTTLIDSEELQAYKVLARKAMTE